MNADDLEGATLLLLGLSKHGDDGVLSAIVDEMRCLDAYMSASCYEGDSVAAILANDCDQDGHAESCPRGIAEQAWWDAMKRRRAL